ncbi:hypothetical protein RYX36_029023 [Vicia faba]
MLSNSKFARRSRMRKQKQIEDLTEEACRLKNENDRLKNNIKAAEDANAEMEETNSVVRVQTMELSDRMLFLNLMVENAEVFNNICFIFLSSSSGSPPSESFSSSSSGSFGDLRVSFRWQRSTPRGEEERAYAVEQQIHEAIENEEAETD